MAKVVPEVEIEDKPGPLRVNAGYYYQFGEKYRITNPQFIANHVKQGNIMRMEKDLYRVQRAFIFDKIIGEKI